MEGYWVGPAEVRADGQSHLSFIFYNNGNIDIPITKGQISIPNPTEIVSVGFSGEAIFSNTDLKDEDEEDVKDWVLEEDEKIIPYTIKNLTPGEQFVVSLTAENFTTSIFEFEAEAIGLTIEEFLQHQTFRDGCEQRFVAIQHCSPIERSEAGQGEAD